MGTGRRYGPQQSRFARASNGERRVVPTGELRFDEHFHSPHGLFPGLQRAPHDHFGAVRPRHRTLAAVKPH